MPVAVPPRRAPSRASTARLQSQASSARRPPARARPASALRARGDGRIRWDRVGRIALLILLAVVLALYVSPLKQWLAQSQAADEQRRALHALERERERLTTDARQLRQEPALEREARHLGMVRRGERAFVIEGPAPSR